MATTVVGTSVGGRNGAGTVTVTPPAGSASYLAVVVSSQVVAPSGWTLLAAWADSGAASGSPANYNIYQGDAGAGSVWTKSAGSGPMSVVVVGYSTQVTATVVSAASQTSPATTIPGSRMIARVVMDQNDGSAALSYPTAATVSRQQKVQYYATDGYSASVGVAHQAATAGSVASAAWTVPSAYLPRAVTIALEEIVLPDTPTGLTGVINAATPTGTVAPPTVAWSGTVASAPVAGVLAANTPTVQAGPPVASWGGTVTAPTFAGAVTADTPAVAVTAPAVAWGGTVTVPSFTGDLTGSTPTVQVGPVTAVWTAAGTAPTVAGLLAADTPDVTLDPVGAAWAGASTVPVFNGQADAATPPVAVSVPVSAPGAFAGTITADTPAVAKPVDITVTGRIEPSRWSGTLHPSRWVEGITPQRWKGTLL